MKGCRPLTDSEINGVLAYFEANERHPERTKALFLLGIYCGYRISESLSLRVKSVYQGGKIMDRVTVERKHMKKKMESRTIILNHRVKDALKDLIDLMSREGKLEPDRCLFTGNKSQHQPMTRAGAWFLMKKAFEACGIFGQTGTHSCRKTFADRIFKRLNFDLVKTQKALSHHQIASTLSYLSFREEEIDQAVLAL